MGPWRYWHPVPVGGFCISEWGPCPGKSGLRVDISAKMQPIDLVPPCRCNAEHIARSWLLNGPSSPPNVDGTSPGHHHQLLRTIKSVTGFGLDMLDIFSFELWKHTLEPGLLLRRSGGASMKMSKK